MHSSASTSTLTSVGKMLKRSGGGIVTSPTGEDSAGSPAKKPLTVSHAGTTAVGGKARTPRFTKDEMEIALKGMQPTLREAREKRDRFRRFGLAGHKWMFSLNEISLASTKKSGQNTKQDASERSTAVATDSAAKKKAPVHTVGPSVTSLPMSVHILAKLRVKAGNTQQPRVSSST